jgi:hypothetical protein
MFTYMVFAVVTLISVMKVSTFLQKEKEKKKDPDKTTIAVDLTKLLFLETPFASSKIFPLETHSSSGPSACASRRRPRGH